MTRRRITRRGQTRPQRSSTETKNKRKSHKFFDKISERLRNPASNGLEVIAPPHLKSTVGSGVFEEVCVCVFLPQCVLILYPYLQICLCCLSDPPTPLASNLSILLLAKHSVAPQRVCVCWCVLWIIVAKILLKAISSKNSEFAPLGPCTVDYC